MARRSNIVTVVNRTEGPISYMFDGAQHTLQPGENSIEAVEVEFAKTQNIVMGSENPLNPAQYISLVGVKAKPGQKQRDDISQIIFTTDERRQVHAVFEDGSSMPLGLERIDRRFFGPELQNVTIEKNRIPLRRFEIERTNLNDAVAGAVGG